MRSEDTLRYEATDPVPRRVALGFGLQHAVLAVNPVVLLPTITFRAAGADAYLLWGVFASLLCSGISTVAQAVRPGRWGGGYLLVHGPASIFIAVGAAALVEGGPSMLATLVVISGLMQTVVSARLSLLHRILTPVVTGTVMMLVGVSIMPILFRMMSESPAGVPAPAGPLTACVALVTVVAIHLKGGARLVPWALLAGIAAGSVAGGFVGTYDIALLAEAEWIGVPGGRPPGMDLGFGPEFWALLLTFLFISLAGTTKSIGLAVATQRVSWRGRRAVDFRAVQRTVSIEGLGNVLAGLAGTLPNAPVPTPVSTIQMTGVASRRVGIAAGFALIGLAFLPRAVGVVLAVPDAVLAAALAVGVAILFLVGMREVVSGTRDNPRNGLIASLSFWTGIGFEFDLVFPHFFADFAGGFFSQGMTAGGLVAILLTVLTLPRLSRFRGRLDAAEWPRIRDFVGDFARSRGLQASLARLEAASEETLLTLLNLHEARGGRAPDEETEHEGEPERRTLLLTASKEGGDALLQFKVSAPGQEDLNLQDRLAWLGDETPGGAEPEAQEISLRLLRHLASSVRHQQFRDVDIVTLRVAADSRAGRGR